MRLLGLLIFVGLLTPSALRAGLADELDAQKLADLKKGKQIVLTEEVEGFAWPRYSIYRLINATPTEAAAVFFDYNSAYKFIPNVLTSEISKNLTSSTQEVSYSVDVPLLADEHYTTRNALKQIPDGYRIDWNLLRATSVKSTVGCFTVESMGDKCLLRYQNLVDPGSNFAGLLRSFAGKQIQDTVAAISSEIETQKTDDPEALKQKVDRLQKALK